MSTRRCVYQMLRHQYARYTPEMVAEICGVPPERFIAVAEALCENSGRERTSAICYAVGWTQHSHGVQNIRAASIIQLLLGNIGRPGGGILALRGHANIQGSTDIPTLYDILPSYIPMPHPVTGDSLDEFVEKTGPTTGVWGELRSYMTSLLKAWWGEHATAENDYCLGYLPTIDGDHSVYPMMISMLEGKTKGYFIVGQNPVVGNANSGLHVKALASLDWLVVRDMVEIESAHVLARLGADRDRRAQDRRDRHRGLLPARRRAHGEGRHVHQHAAAPAVAPQGRRAAGGLPLGAVVRLRARPPRPREARRLR